MNRTHEHFSLWLGTGVLLFAACGGSTDASRRADTSTVENALGTGLSLLHVRLSHAGPQQTAHANDNVTEYIPWDMELVGQRLGLSTPPFPSQLRFNQSLSVYNERDMVGHSYTWTGGSQRPVMAEGSHYLLVSTGRWGAAEPVVPGMAMLIRLDPDGRTTEPLFNMPSGTPLDVFMPPVTLTPPASGVDAGVDAAPGE